MSSLDLLKQAANAIPFLKFDELEIGHEYPIDRFEWLADTKYGPCVVVYINGDMLYLPKRFIKIFKTAEQVEGLNKVKYVMIYHGKDVILNNRVLLDFELAKDAGVDMVDGKP